MCALNIVLNIHAMSFIVIFAMSLDSTFVMNIPVKQPMFNYDSLNQYETFLSFRDKVEVLINGPYGS